MNKAWDELTKVSSGNKLTVKFLADEYEVDLQAKSVFSASCNVPAKDFTAILILHYLIKKIQGLSELKGEWLPFRELSGVEGYADAFKRRVIDPIIRKYGNNPEKILSALERFPAKKSGQGDVSIIIEAFEKVPVLVVLWRPDEEFSPEVNVLFDRSITEIFCTEDIIVLAGIVAGQV